MKTIFWLSFLMLSYVYLGYPAILYLISIFFKKRIKRKDFYPDVSIIISVYNEEKNIEEKIKNLLDLDYPEEKLEILIGSDGSTDGTNQIISKYLNGRVKFYLKEKREGKPDVLNVLCSIAKGDILVFTDARQRLDRESLKELLKDFSDERIGSVSAELFFEENKTNKGTDLYWKYEKFIRNSESKIGSMLGATGAMYAVRRELFSELPKDLILDDVYIPLKIVQKGYRAIFESRAKIYDRLAKDAKEEFIRKTRTLCGNFQIFVYLKGLFNPFKNPIWWQLFSHKFLRLLAPFFLVILFISNLFILKNYFYKIFLIFQILFYKFAFFGLVFKNRNALFNIPYMFCVMNSAAVVGLYKFLTRRQDVLWEKVEYEKERLH